MTGPSPWRLSSPRGGVTSVTVSGSTIEPVGSIILLPVPGTTLLRGRETSRKAVARTRRGIDMNVTLITAIVLLLAWGTLVFGAHLGSGRVRRYVRPAAPVGMRVPQAVLIGGWQGEEVHRFRKQRVAHLLERPDRDDPETAPVGRYDEVPLRERERHRLDGDIWQILAEAPPRLAAVR